MNGLFSGFFLSFSLILAIGAQNAFILKQGLRREHVFSLCLLCAFSDALLISAGVFGFSFIAGAIPIFERYALYGGVLFLVFYGAKSFWAAFYKNGILDADENQKTPFFKALLTCLAFTWLNPHVYLDTVVLLGSISTQFPDEKYQFAFGATLASLVFFFSLGYGARLLSPIFKSSISWKILDFFIGVIMWTLAFNLLYKYSPT